MKKCMLSAVALVALVAAPVLAGEGVVSKSKLNSLGLGQMTAMSDAQGMLVRGMSSNAQATSFNSYSASLFLSDASGTASFASNGQAFGRGTAENAGLSAISLAGTFTQPVSTQTTATAQTISLNPGGFTASFGAFSGTGLSYGHGQ